MSLPPHFMLSVVLCEKINVLNMVVLAMSKHVFYEVTVTLDHQKLIAKSLCPCMFDGKSEEIPT